MDGEEINEEQEQQLKDLWKVYGRETEMGKKLFALYNKAEKPKINYPKTRPKSQKEIDAEKTRAIVEKKCPQKTAIEYPDAPRPVGKTYHPIDFVPKRKA